MRSLAPTVQMTWTHKAQRSAGIPQLRSLHNLKYFKLILQIPILHDLHFTTFVNNFQTRFALHNSFPSPGALVYLVDPLKIPSNNALSQHSRNMESESCEQTVRFRNSEVFFCSKFYASLSVIIASQVVP